MALMLRRSRCLGAVLTVVLMVGVAPAFSLDMNGFMREQGKGDIALSYTWENYDTFWAGDTEVKKVGEVTTTSWSLWFDYGLSDRLNVIASLPYVKAEGDRAFDGLEEEGLQDLTVALKYRFASLGTNWRHDFIGGFGFRTIASNYEPNSPVDIGDGTADWLFRLIYQLNRGGFYFSQQVGFDYRSGDAPNGFPCYTETGYTWSVVTFSGFYQSLKAQDGTDIGDPGFTFPSNEEEYQRAGGKIFARFGDSFGVGGMFWKTLDGKNTGDSKGISGGVNIRF